MVESRHHSVREAIKLGSASMKKSAPITTGRESQPTDEYEQTTPRKRNKVGKESERQEQKTRESKPKKTQNLAKTRGAKVSGIPNVVGMFFILRSFFLCLHLGWIIVIRSLFLGLVSFFFLDMNDMLDRRFQDLL